METADATTEATPRPEARRRRRGWAWVALIGAVLVALAELPTWSFSLALSPLTFALSLAAWWRSPRDELFLVGFALNAVLVLSLAGILLGIVTGDTAIGFE